MTDQWTELEKLAKAADDEVCALAEGKRKWTMSIPVQSTDSDILISDALRKIPHLIALARSEAVLRSAAQNYAHCEAECVDCFLSLRMALAESDRLRGDALDQKEKPVIGSTQKV